MPLNPSKFSLQMSNSESTIAKLKAMAAQLRAEAAQLEAERREVMANAIAEVFDTFDTNRDGSISIDELRDGLEKELKGVVTNEQARQLMAAFDSSGDGSLQLEEFKSVQEFQAKLESMIIEERINADKATQLAREAKVAAETANKMVAELSEYLNDRPPTLSDRALSTLPYLLPFVDALNYAKPFINQIGANPLTEILAFLFNTYQSIPFSGLVAFIALNVVSNNLQLNRLIRYNIQQAILSDIALIIPGLIGGTLSVLLGSSVLTQSLSEEASTFTFFLISATLLYCVVSSLLGITPNKVPFISNNVEDRMPSVSNFMDTFSRLQESNNSDASKNRPKNSDKTEKEDSDSPNK